MVLWCVSLALCTGSMENGGEQSTSLHWNETWKMVCAMRFRLEIQPFSKRFQLDSRFERPECDGGIVAVVSHAIHIHSVDALTSMCVVPFKWFSLGDGWLSPFVQRILMILNILSLHHTMECLLCVVAVSMEFVVWFGLVAMHWTLISRKWLTAKRQFSRDIEWPTTMQSNGNGAPAHWHKGNSFIVNVASDRITAHYFQSQ